MNQTEYDKVVPLITDIEWRLDNLYYIKDKEGNIIKFVRNESQCYLWDNRHTLNAILKDRQRGFSTFIAILMLDTCFFNATQECGIVDITREDGKKKIAKIKLAYESLPDALKRKNVLTVDNKEELIWDNGSSVHSGVSHRGGTLQVLHISELGKISVRNPEKAREIRTGAFNTLSPGSFIFIESTAEGRSGEFFNICQTSMLLRDNKSVLTDLDFKFFFFGWWMDGNKNEIDPEGVEIPRKLEKYFNDLEEQLGIRVNPQKRAWYTKKSEQQREDMLREFPATPEEAFDASIEGAYLAGILSKLRKDGQITPIAHDPSSPVNTAWDFGLSDNMTIWLHQFVAMQHRLIGFISGTDEDVLFYWRKLQDLPFMWGNHFLPHDAGQRRIGTAKRSSDKPKTLKDIMAESGMRNIKVVPRTENKATAIQEVKLFLPQCFISTTCDDQPEWSKLDKKDYKGGILCLQNYRREWDEKLGIWKSTPRHDWASHGYDSLETLARGWNKFGGSTGKPRNDYSKIQMNTFIS